MKDMLERPFQENLKALFCNVDANRQSAWDHFLELGLPSKEMEVFRYVRLKKLYEHTFKAPTLFDPQEIAAHLLPESREAYCIFVNGCYRPDLSRLPEGLVALPLSAAFKTYGSFLNSRLIKQLKEEKDPFATLNGALYQDGLFLYLPPKVECKAPLQILHLLEGEGYIASPRIHLFMGKESTLRLSMTQSGKGRNLWVNSYIDLALEERASLSLTSCLEEEQAIGHFEAVRATLKKQSVFKSWSVTNGSSLSRQDYVVRLAGSECEASLYGVWNVHRHREHHVNVLMDHQEPNTSSLQTFKGIIGGQARSSFEGKIYVHQKAQKTQAYQMNRNLILSKHASAYCKPNLEIFADDVKASHGATIGQLDKEQLFYLTTRGISKDQAQRLLLQGFFQEVIEGMPILSLKERAVQLMGSFS